MCLEINPLILQQITVFLMGVIGAFIWIFLSLRFVPNFTMKVRRIGECPSVVIWCLFGGFFAWLLNMVGAYGGHPAMFCGVLTGFGWSGLFMGVSATISLYIAKDALAIAEDLGNHSERLISDVENIETGEVRKDEKQS